MEKNIMKPRGAYGKREEKEYDERVIEIARVSRVVKGGRRIRFRATVILGNRNGKIAMGIAKANEVADAVRKASASAKKHFITIPIINGTIPHEVFVKHGGAKVMLRPAASGTSIVAGGSIRQVAELSGITDLLTKSLGSSNKINVVTATIKALSSFNKDITEKIRKFSESKNVPALEKKEVQAENTEKETGKKTIKKTIQEKDIKKDDNKPKEKTKRSEK